MNLGSIQHLNWAQTTLVFSDLCVCCCVNEWATLNVSLEIYNSATQDDRTHTDNKTSTRRDTHRPPPQPPSIRHLPITSSYKMQPDNSWCSWILWEMFSHISALFTGSHLEASSGNKHPTVLSGKSYFCVFLVKYLSVCLQDGKHVFSVGISHYLTHI